MQTAFGGRDTETHLSMAPMTVGPRHQLASSGSVGDATRFWPVGPTAGSHWMAVSLKPHALRNGSSCALRHNPAAVKAGVKHWRYR